MRKLIGPAELADWLGVPRSTVYRWRADGYGPSVVKIGKHLRYDPDDVEAWLKAQHADDRQPAA